MCYLILLYRDSIHQSELMSMSISDINYKGIFFTMLTIALSCMMMITFRAALYPVNKETGALAKTANVDVVQYQQNMNEPQDGVGQDLHLHEEMNASNDEPYSLAQPY